MISKSDLICPFSIFFQSNLSILDLFWIKFVHFQFFFIKFVHFWSFLVNKIKNDCLNVNYLIKNGWIQSKMVEFNQKCQNQSKIQLFSTIFDQIWLNNQHKDYHFWSFIQKNDQKWLNLIKKWSKMIDFNQNYIEIAIIC